MGFGTPSNNNRRPKKNVKPFLGIIIIGFLFIGLFFFSGIFEKPIDSKTNISTLTQEQLFDTHSINPVHLQFTNNDWLNMQPVGGPFSKNEEGEPWWDIGMSYGPLYISAGDTDRDEMFSRKEFTSLAERWFEEWNINKNDSLDTHLFASGFMKSTNGAMNLQGPDRNGIARVLGVQTPTVQANLKFGNLDMDAVTVRYKGNGTLLETQNSLKRPFKVDINDGFQGRKIAGVSKLNFHNLFTDAGYMNDVIAYQLFRDGGVPSPRTSYAQMYISVPDTLQEQYLGLYLLVENVDNNFAQEWYETKKGVIFKPVTPKLFDYLGDDWNNYIRTYEPKTPLSVQESNQIISLCKLVSSGSEEDFNNGIGKYIDLDNFARYLAINVFIGDLDGILGPGQNMYLYLHPKTFKLSFIAWDHDHSFGQMRGTQEEREQLSLEKPWMFSNHFLERMFANEEFKALYLKYMKEFSETIFRPDRIKSQIDELAKTIRPSVEMESNEQLKKFDFTVGWNGIENDPLDSAEKVDPKPLRSYITARHQSVMQQLNGLSKGLEIESFYFPEKWIVEEIMWIYDNNADSIVTRKEFVHTFDSLFNLWAPSGQDYLSTEEFINGMNTNMNVYGLKPLDSISTDD